MYLHEDREMFRTIVEQVAEESGKNSIVIEKDYYVTMILRLLSEQLELYVFKGGTSLSKGFHVINRFSEDIDITFNEHIGESRRKKLKHVVLKGISEKLGMPIVNWDEIIMHIFFRIARCLHWRMKDCHSMLNWKWHWARMHFPHNR